MTALAHADHDTAVNSNGLRFFKRMDTTTAPLCVKQTHFRARVEYQVILLFESRVNPLL